jgi:hypothetical protein
MKKNFSDNFKDCVDRSLRQWMVDPDTGVTGTSPLFQLRSLAEVGSELESENS